MLEFLSNNWVWILLIGGMLFMHLGHGGRHGGHGGCGGHHALQNRPRAGEKRAPAPPGLHAGELT